MESQEPPAIDPPEIEPPAIDWSDCPLVERNPLKLSGVPILKGTRLQADSVVENYEHGSPVEEIADNFDIPERIVKEILTFAAAKGRDLHL